jgi:hypothetical protein
MPTLFAGVLVPPPPGRGRAAIRGDRVAAWSHPEAPENLSASVLLAPWVEPGGVRYWFLDEYINANGNAVMRRDAARAGGSPSW